MKKILVLFLLLTLLAVPGFSTKTGGTPIVGGGTGVITVPSASTIGKGGLDFGFYYIGPDTIAISGGFGFVKDLDLSFGFEMDDNNPNLDPFIQIRGKFRFSDSGSAGAWAFGADLAMAKGDDTIQDDLKFSLYLVNSFYPSSWQFTWGFGYTFEDGNDDSINFFVGLSKEIIKNLYIEMDFSNYPNRYYADSDSNNSARGIGNIAARLHLFDGLLRLSLGLFDAFDSNRVFGLGVAVKLKLF